MKLSKITLRTHQFEAIKTFYGELLGLPVLEDASSPLSFQAGSTMLSFTESSPKESPYYHIAFTIPTNKFQEAKKWLMEKGISLVSSEGSDEFLFENWNATALYFYDPDHNLIEFIAHHTINNATDEPFESKHLLHISEIGLPVDDVPEAVSMLSDAFQLNKWSGDGLQFAAMGDAEGLFIVVNKQRPWFPDNRVPATFDTAVTFEGMNSPTLLLQNGLYHLKSASS
jgi:catechol-2,3-dioxygenase